MSIYAIWSNKGGIHERGGDSLLLSICTQGAITKWCTNSLS